MNAPASFEKRSPVTGEKLADYHITTKAEVDEAVGRARDAFPGWSELPLETRLKKLARVREIVKENGEEYAERISDDTGKPLVDSLMTELLSIPLFIDYYEKQAPKVLSRHKVRNPLVLPGKTSYVGYFPMGVVGVISPWNFPFQLSMIPVLSALIPGNTVVLKPSEVTPGTGEVMREIFEKANLPEGVVQVLQGDGSTGAALCKADVDKLFFTGSVATGRKVMAAAAVKPIPVELELGGKDVFIVCHDADLRRAAKACAWGALINCGQMCISVERILVVDDVYDEFVGLLEKEVRRVTVGGPDEDADIGPMTFRKQIDTVKNHLEDAISHGAKILFGGDQVDREGDFFEPTIVTDVDDTMDIYREETFGPVLPIVRVRDEDEAVRMANDHQYGLSGSVWAGDRKRGLELASRVEAGQVMVNDVVLATGNPVLPFGGVKNSGIGRYHGTEGLLSFVHTKAIMMDRGWFKNEPFWFPYEGKYPHMLEAYHALLDGNLPKALLNIMKLRRMTD